MVAQTVEDYLDDLFPKIKSLYEKYVEGVEDAEEKDLHSGADAVARNRQAMGSTRARPSVSASAPLVTETFFTAGNFLFHAAGLNRLDLQSYPAGLTSALPMAREIYGQWLGAGAQSAFLHFNGQALKHTRQDFIPGQIPESVQTRFQHAGFQEQQTPVNRETQEDEKARRKTPKGESKKKADEEEIWRQSSEEGR
ncbi:MAG: hypothetical protein Q9161_004250 [Pseudevernia consocians]